MVTFPLHPYQQNIALIDGDTGRQFSYGDLIQEQERFSKFYPLQKGLIFLFSQNSMDEVAAYIAAINLEHVVCLLDARLKLEIKQQLVHLYMPDMILEGDDNKWEGYQQAVPFYADLQVWQNIHQERTPLLHPDLQLLLSTSGTTGSPKLIRLSKVNLLSNAESIEDFLVIKDYERAIASLPIHYSYGLSVLHSHLIAGASIVLTKQSIVQAGFWNVMNQYNCTSFAGVPYSYQMLERLDFDQIDVTSLKTMTQAGGKLDKALVLKYYELMKSRGGKFIVMYGQTEATARIAYLPIEFLPQKAGAIGKAIPGGKLHIFEGEHEIKEPGKIGELVYEGSNVMMGYADGPQDLVKGYDQHGVLLTGDLGYFDEDGIFYVTGRNKRISKVYGARINLDELEEHLQPFGEVAVSTDDQRIFLFFEKGSVDLCERCIHELSEKYQIHYSTFVCRIVDKLPRTSSGKIDYKRLL